MQFCDVFTDGQSGVQDVREQISPPISLLKSCTQFNFMGLISTLRQLILFDVVFAVMCIWQHV